MKADHLTIRKIFAATILSLITFFLPAQVQDELNLKLERAVFLQEAISSTVNSSHLVFPNINKFEYYDNNRLREAIKRCEEINDFIGLDSLLSKYVLNFGPSNFREDIEYIWKAAQIKDLLGDTIAALLFYDLACKNTRPINEKIKIHYDSLVMRTKTAWVDLKFYYKILEARRKMDPLVPPAGVILNMGPKVNSEKPDYAPFMHPSDSILVFTSRRDEEIVIDDLDAARNEDLYFSQRDWMSGAWTYAEKFTKEINSPYNEGSSCLSRDGRTLIFARCDEPGAFGDCDLYQADFVGSEWKHVRNLGINVNSIGWDSHPSLTPDGNALFYTSNRPGGFGKCDIYVSYRQPDGSWTKAENLGPAINTMDDEVTPFFHQVNQTLYFSSNGHLLNMGGYDIFKSRWMSKFWEEPKNIGPLVNGAGSEYYFTIDGKGKRLFYAMSKSNDKRPEVYQNFDLYSFPMPMEARPDAIVTLKGYLIDSISLNPITGIILVVDKETGIEVAPKYINSFGYFEFDLINNKKYEIYIQGENFLMIKDEISLKGDTTFKIMTESLRGGRPLVFESLQFAENSYDLDASIEPKLDYLVDFLKRYPMFDVVVKGHTDSNGDAKYNLDLSRKRAAIIRKFIVKKGELEESRVDAKGYGESRPLVANDTELHKQLNRRVEFEISVNPDYEGEIFLPAEEELDMNDDAPLDPEFMEEDSLDEVDENAEPVDFNWDEEIDIGKEFGDEDDSEFLIETDVIPDEEDEEIDPDDE